MMRLFRMLVFMFSSSSLNLCPLLQDVARLNYPPYIYTCIFIYFNNYIYIYIAPLEGHGQCPLRQRKIIFSGAPFSLILPN